MWTNPKCTQSRRAIARDLAIAAALLATIAMAPAIAAADGDDAAYRAAPGAPEQERTSAGDPQSTDVAIDDHGASASDLRDGSEVRAAYQGTSGTASGIRIKSTDETRAVQSGEDASAAVQTMSPSDPEWDSVHQGG